MNQSARRLGTRNRRGSILIVVLACSVAALSLVMVALQASLHQRRQLRTELQLEQTRWVLDAAIRKSIADPSEEVKEVVLKPKLEKFDKVRFWVTPNQDKGQVTMMAKIGNDADTDLTSRSASFELKQQDEN